MAVFAAIVRFAAAANHHQSRQQMSERGRALEPIDLFVGMRSEHETTVDQLRQNLARERRLPVELSVPTAKSHAEEWPVARRQLLLPISDNYSCRRKVSKGAPLATAAELGNCRRPVAGLCERCLSFFLIRTRCWRWALVENRPRFSKDRWTRSVRPRVRQRPRPLVPCAARSFDRSRVSSRGEPHARSTSRVVKNRSTFRPSQRAIVAPEAS
jgi:hypothetical protein